MHTNRLHKKGNKCFCVKVAKQFKETESVKHWEDNTYTSVILVIWSNFIEMDLSEPKTDTTCCDFFCSGVIPYSEEYQIHDAGNNLRAAVQPV